MLQWVQFTNLERHCNRVWVSHTKSRCHLIPFWIAAPTSAPGSERTGFVRTMWDNCSGKIGSRRRASLSTLHCRKCPVNRATSSPIFCPPNITTLKTIRYILPLCISIIHITAERQQRKSLTWHWSKWHICSSWNKRSHLPWQWCYSSIEDSCKIPANPLDHRPLPHMVERPNPCQKGHIQVPNTLKTIMKTHKKFSRQLQPDMVGKVKGQRLFRQPQPNSVRKLKGQRVILMTSQIISVI